MVSSLPKKFTVTDDQGTNPIHFGTPPSRDLEDDRRAAAVNKAAEVKPEIEETGVLFNYLSREVREELYWDDRILVGRFLEQVYITGFLHGPITAKEASEITNWDYQVCLRALKEVSEYLLEKQADFEKAGVGKLLSEFFRLEKEQRRKENNNNSPKNHKKKEGQRDKRGPKSQKYYIPSQHLLNYSHRTLIPYPFDMSVLKSNKLYSAAIAKMLRFEGKSIHTRLKDEAKRLGISRPTLNSWLDAMNVSHDEPWSIEVEITPEELNDVVAEDANEQVILMKKHQQTFGIVRSKETRETRAANLDAILGRVPDKKHYERTGEFVCLPPLEGILVRDKRIGTIVTDKGGFVYKERRSVQ